MGQKTIHYVHTLKEPWWYRGKSKAVCGLTGVKSDNILEVNCQRCLNIMVYENHDICNSCPVGERQIKNMKCTKHKEYYCWLKIKRTIDKQIKK